MEINVVLSCLFIWLVDLLNRRKEVAYEYV
jgi:hypothetical protein